MNQDRNTAEKITKLTNEQVAEFLRVNPEFFENNPDLLAEIEIPHIRGEGTTSLIEHQVKVLREQNEILKDQLKTFAVLAIENEDIWVRFKDLAIMLLNHSSPSSLKTDIENWLKRQFNLCGVMINLDKPSKTLKKFKQNDAYKIVVDDAQIHCHSHQSDELLATLFGSEDAAKVNSCALIPLKNASGDSEALLALGSENTERFTSSQSTAYLDCLSQLISEALIQQNRSV